MNRRTFVTGTAAGVTLGLSPTLHALARRPMKNDEIRAAVIGIRSRGRGLLNELRGLRETHNVRVVAVADVDQTFLDREAKAFEERGEPLVVEQDFRRLLDRDDINGLRSGENGFEAFGPTDLRVLYHFGDYWLVSRPDFPDQHATLVIQTLTEHGAGVAKRQGLPSNEAPAPIHQAVNNTR